MTPLEALLTVVLLGAVWVGARYACDAYLSWVLSVSFGSYAPSDDELYLTMTEALSTHPIGGYALSWGDCRCLQCRARINQRGWLPWVLPLLFALGWEAHVRRAVWRTVLLQGKEFDARIERSQRLGHPHNTVCADGTQLTADQTLQRIRATELGCTHSPLGFFADSDRT